MGLFNKNKTKSNDNNIVEKAVEEIQEWIWVDGYKLTDENMKVDDFQFEIGGTYKHEQRNLNEFTFSLNHSCQSTGFTDRCFKVKVLVDMKDYMYFKSYPNIKKYNHAKEIQLIEEVPKEEIYKIIKDNFKMIDTYEEFCSIKNVNDYYEIFTFTKFFNSLSSYYSDTFIKVLYNTCLNFYGNRDWNIYNYKEKALALAEDGVSPDMRAYLLLNVLLR